MNNAPVRPSKGSIHVGAENVQLVGNPPWYSFHLLGTMLACYDSFHSMETLISALPYAEIVLAILLIIGIVLQQRGATLGGAFGGDNFASTFYKRRGAEKFLFNATIAVAVLLVLAAIANFLLQG